MRGRAVGKTVVELKMVRYRICCALLVTIILVIQGCAPTTFIFRSKAGLSNSISYLTKERVPLRIDIPGIYWKISQPNYNIFVFQSTQGPRRIVNIFEYNDGLLRQRFYKKGVSEEQAIEKYSEAESAWQITRAPDLQRKVIATNVDGPITPNILWSLDGPKMQIFFIAMSKDRHLISITAQDLDQPPNGQEFVLMLFRSMKLLTAEQVDSILRAETNY